MTDTNAELNDRLFGPDRLDPLKREVPELTHPHTADLEYKIGDRVLLRATDRDGVEVEDSPFTGAVSEPYEAALLVVHDHQPEDPDGMRQGFRLNRKDGTDVDDYGQPLLLTLLGRADRPEPPLDSMSLRFVQGQIFELAAGVAGMPLEKLLKVCEDAEKVDTIQALEDLTRALLPFQAVALRLAEADTEEEAG